ncbi:hypothetical protein QQ020_06415 [Fulvivirgaceae bacterium BMA12]|uniref:SGNH/GDSL hydrolase family protein n=1 Tax=Agaribacillus aureus TaxID=3051825 RepID=A0ABT8L1U7_9BACT|nr:hypothetical protein [Fulvivirgaceae bacterium BMA12]
MEAKKFLLKVSIISLSTIAVFVTFNYFLDIYGLFRPDDQRELKVYTNERTSKYLLSYHYIPDNFEGIIIGPSLSANLNTKTIKEYKIYNASIMGANISELRYLVDNIVERGNLRFVIICLDPYLTKDHGKKSARIDPKEYYGALGSTNLIKTYLFKLIRENELLPDKFPNNIINDYGYNNFNLELKEDNPREKILEKVRQKSTETTYVDPAAEDELGATIAYLRQNNIQVIAYFSPVPHQILAINTENYRAYQNRMLRLFTEQDIVLDLNDLRFKAITSDFNTYIDHGHLSEEGQKFVLGELKQALLENVQPRNLKYSER